MKVTRAVAQKAIIDYLQYSADEIVDRDENFDGLSSDEKQDLTGLVRDEIKVLRRMLHRMLRAETGE